MTLLCIWLCFIKGDGKVSTECANSRYDHGRAYCATTDAQLGRYPYTITGELGYESRIKNALSVARAEGHIKSNDLIGVLAGITGDSPATDVLRIMRVP